MVDLRPLLFLNALIIMLFLTAGFAHIKQPASVTPLVAEEPPAANPTQTLAETASQIAPDQNPFGSVSDEPPVFADEVDSQNTAVAVNPAENLSDVNTPEPAPTVIASLDATVAEPLDASDRTPPPVVEEPVPEKAAPVIEPPPVGTLIVRSNVSGDKVRINGKDYGSTKLDLELSPGEYVVEITKPGYKGWTTSVSVNKGGQRVVTANLEQITTVDYSNGSWRYGIVTGEGSYESNDGSRYVGGFLNKQFHGHGKLVLPDGTSYEGDWNNGKKDGYGTLILSNGDTYVGNFRADEFSGEGTLTKSNGDIYTGIWANGKLNGEGSLTTKQGLMYVGGFIDNEFSGNGNITYPDGTHYEGGFTKSLFHGKGVLTYQDGKKYTGQFIEGQFHGKGELQNPNGSKITGTFKFGKPYGQAALTTPEGEVFTARSSEPGICYRLKSYRATQCPPMEGW